MSNADRLLNPIAALGRWGIEVVEGLGRFGVFFASAVIQIFAPPFKPRRVLQQIQFIGMKSLFIVSLTGLFTGMVLGLQLFYTLTRFGAESVLGAAVALSLIRELGPVITALIVTGRAGSSMAAELGIMRISDQIDALNTMDIPAVKFLVSPRMAASMLSFPLLVAIFDCIGIVGGYVTGVMLLGIDSGTYLGRMEDTVLMKDVAGGFIKSFVFGLIVCSVCCYKGYTTHLRREGFGAKGVSLSTTSAVVVSSVLVLVGDYVLTSFLL